MARLELLLGSGGIRTPERLAVWQEHVRGILGDSVRRVLFVPYALADHDAYLRMMTDKGYAAGYALDGLHEEPDPADAVRRAEAIYVGGGNTFRLLDRLQRLDLIHVIRERVWGGMPYIGVSAGANVAGPTICTTNDMPIVLPQTVESLGLVPFQMNPHYFVGPTYLKDGDGFSQLYGETRDDRIREFHEENKTPVVALWEGGVLRVSGNGIKLSGAPARVFRPGADPVEVKVGANLGPALKK